MARQNISSRQAETKASIENVPINSNNKSSNQTDRANKQIKQTNRSSNKQIKQTSRSSKQADQASKQIKQTNKIAKGRIYLALSKPSRQVEIKRTSGIQASVEYRARKIEQRI